VSDDLSDIAVRFERVEGAVSVACVIVTPMSLISWAFSIAEQKLAHDIPRRWSHVQGAARQARSVRAVVGSDAELLEATAVLHDVGYAPSLAETGFHPLDGARFLRTGLSLASIA
jgi:hypothetical protein